MAVIGLIPTAGLFVIVFMRIEGPERWTLVLTYAACRGVVHLRRVRPVHVDPLAADAARTMDPGAEVHPLGLALTISLTRRRNFVASTRRGRNEFVAIRVDDARSVRVGEIMGSSCAELFHRHIAVTAVMLAAIGGASAQPERCRSANPRHRPPPSDRQSRDTARRQRRHAAGNRRPAVVEPVPAAEPATRSTCSRFRSRRAAGHRRRRRREAARIADRRAQPADRPQVRTAPASRRSTATAASRRFGSPMARRRRAPRPRPRFSRGVDADGLDPADYPVPRVHRPETDKLAQDELALTNSVLAFARHARTGRISFSRVSGAIFYELATPEAADVLANMANADDLRDALNSYHPQHPAYRRSRPSSRKRAPARRTRPSPTR